MPRYVVAVRRERRAEGITTERIRDLPGVEVKGSQNPNQVVIEASPRTAAEIAERFTDDVIIEEEQRYDPQRR